MLLFFFQCERWLGYQVYSYGVEGVGDVGDFYRLLVLAFQFYLLQAQLVYLLAGGDNLFAEAFDPIAVVDQQCCTYHDEQYQREEAQCFACGEDFATKYLTAPRHLFLLFRLVLGFLWRGLALRCRWLGGLLLLRLLLLHQFGLFNDDGFLSMSESVGQGCF